jgi:N-acetyl-anhydromuramyl-L-alanine amidase AmpD
MSNSSLVNYTKLSPNCSSPRTNTIKKITIHHMAGNLTVEDCGELFAKTSRGASSNYGIGTDGRVGMYVEERNRAWTSGNRDNDQQAVTIEVANCKGAPNWEVSDAAYSKLIDLCVDICKRNNITKLNYTGNASGNLTMHSMFAATACPGPYLKSKFSDIAAKVNAKLAPATIYRVQLGAFAVKSNADAMLKKVQAAGFEAFIAFSGNLYKIQVGAFAVKSNADAMLKKVQAAGFEAFITTETNQVVESQPTTQLKSNAEIAKEVLAGKWGNGQERIDRLTAAGYDPSVIQREVDKLF